MAQLNFTPDFGFEVKTPEQMHQEFFDELVNNGYTDTYENYLGSNWYKFYLPIVNKITAMQATFVNSMVAFFGQLETTKQAISTPNGSSRQGFLNLLQGKALGGQLVDQVGDPTLDDNEIKLAIDTFLPPYVDGQGVIQQSLLATELLKAIGPCVLTKQTAITNQSVILVFTSGYTQTIYYTYLTAAEYTPCRVRITTTYRANTPKYPQESILAAFNAAWAVKNMIGENFNGETYINPLQFPYLTDVDCEISIDDGSTYAIDFTQEFGKKFATPTIEVVQQ